MFQTFERDGVQVLYPTNWTADQAEEIDEGGWGVMLQSPGTAFVLVSLRPDATDPADLADQTLAVLKAEYQELDSENVVEPLAGLPAIGHDIDFLTLDTSVICRTRCVNTAAGPLLLLSQVSEYDRAENEGVLRAIFASLAVAEE